MEQARIHWWRQAVGGSAWDWTKVGVLVAHHTIDYLSPVRLGDTLEVSCIAGDVGTKSMDVQYTMSCEGRPVAKAKTVLVCFDHREKRTTSVPQEWRDALERLKAPSATNDPNLM
jgi:acyl-CoA thioester hydrolase